MSPEGPAVHVKATPAVWPLPQLTVFVRGDPATFTGWDAVAGVLPVLESLAVLLML